MKVNASVYAYRARRRARAVLHMTAGSSARV
jgi:hypothetical protein